jgi:hypothetical protein
MILSFFCIPKPPFFCLLSSEAHETGRHGPWGWWGDEVGGHRQIDGALPSQDEVRGPLGPPGDPLVVEDIVFANDERTGQDFFPVNEIPCMMI